MPQTRSTTSGVYREKCRLRIWYTQCGCLSVSSRSVSPGTGGPCVSCDSGPAVSRPVCVSCAAPESSCPWYCQLVVS